MSSSASLSLVMPAEALLAEWEERTNPIRSSSYGAARRAMLEQFTALSSLTADSTDVSLSEEDVRYVLHHAFSLRAGTAAANGPDRAGRAAELLAVASEAGLLGPLPAYPASTALLGITSRSGTALEMQELASIMESVRDSLLHHNTELVFGYTLIESQAEELQLRLLIGYGEMVTITKPVAACCPAYLLRTTMETAAQSISPMTGRDVAFEEAAHLFVQHQRASTSLIQRQLKLGYNRTCRLLEQLQTAGIVGQPDDEGQRKVLIANKKQLTQHLALLPNGFLSAD